MCATKLMCATGTEVVALMKRAKGATLAEVIAQAESQPRSTAIR